jgi:hypothetical protein
LINFLKKYPVRIYHTAAIAESKKGLIKGRQSFGKKFLGQ